MMLSLSNINNKHMNIKVKQLSTEDISEIFLLSSKIMTEDFPMYSPKVASIYADHYYSKKFYKKLLARDTNSILGIKDGGELRAIIVLKGDFGGVLFVELLAVKKEYRDKGLGSKLLEAAESWALKHSYHYFWLYTESDKNIEYYKRRGFKHVGVHEGAWFGSSEHIMGKQLKDKPFPEIFSNYKKYLD